MTPQRPVSRKVYYTHIRKGYTLELLCKAFFGARIDLAETLCVAT